MMDNGDVTAGYIVRLVGLMGILVGVAWAVQTVVLGHETTVASTLMWIIAAASVAGAGAGLVMASTHEQLRAAPFRA